MVLLALPLGIVLPTLIGWLGLRLLEGKTPVLFRTERWVAGLVLGLNMSMYVVFLAQVVGLITFNLIGFLGVQILLTVIFGFFWWRKKDHLHGRCAAPAPSPLPSTFVKILVGMFLFWTVCKVVTGSVFLIASPVYFDDVYKNWDLRGKIFYETQHLELGIMQPNGAIDTGGISSYPPAVSMVKTWVSTIAGEWNQGLISSIHMLWFISAVLLLYFALRRLASWQWSMVGAYVLLSLPLYVIHGSVSYADVYLSVHIFLALSYVFFAAYSARPEHMASFFRLAALAAGALVFTKNEALLLHLPPLVLILIVTLWKLAEQHRIGAKEVKTVLIWFAGSIAAVLLPWLIFKWSHGLTFGNAKGITGMELGWQKGVLASIWVNTFLEGNWNLFFPLFIGVMVACWRTALRTPLVVLSAFFLIVYFGQYPLYLFTPLSTEALMQTGYARGLIQLMPIAVLLLVALLAHTKNSYPDKGKLVS